VTIVGSGHVGTALAQVFDGRGDEVVTARREPTHSDEIPIADSARGADLVILTVPFAAVGTIVPALGLSDGQILIDATNPFGRAWPEGYDARDYASGGALVQELAPRSRVVKCFNVIGYEHMEGPQFIGGQALMPVCGNDAAAREEVCAIAEALGFEAVDIGDLSKAALVENLGLLWGTLAVGAGLGRGVAFGLMRQDA
jgi:predicted dinucleotide-binding enzyme